MYILYHATHPIVFSYTDAAAQYCNLYDNVSS